MRTLGIDLASQPKRTAAVVVDWTSDPPRVVPLSDLLEGEPRLNDSTLVELILRDDISRVAIDAPFGWPLEFVDAIYKWQGSQTWPIPLGDPEDLQTRLVLRETDLEVVRATRLPLAPETLDRRGKWPLRVSADRIGVAAMRCARLLGEVANHDGQRVDRAGGGKLLEVYPDAALREWGLWPHTWDHPKQVTYKGPSPEARGRREALMGGFLDQAGPWLGQDSEFVGACIRSDDQLDAFVSAVMAYSVEKGLSQDVTDKARARAEGWIHLPKPGSLAGLLTG